MQDTTLTLKQIVSVTLLAVCCFALTASAQQNNTIGTVAGPGAFSTVATQTAIPDPTGIGEDASGNIYIASQYSFYIYKVNPSTGALSVFAGTGIFGYGQDHVAATTSALSSPVAVSVNKTTGDVYIIDGDRIRCVLGAAGGCADTQGDPAGTIVTYAGTGANCPNAGDTPPTCGDGGPASQATFFAPLAMYIDGHGNLFIADTTDEEIRVINTGASSITVAGIAIAPGTVNTVAGNGLTCNGPFDACGDGGPATAQGKDGAKVDLPQGIITDSNGNIYIGDTRDQRIRCVVNMTGGCAQTAFPSPAVGEIVTYAGIGSPDCSTPWANCGDGGPKLQGKFHNPAGLALDPAGDLLITDQWDNRIREVTTGANGIVETVCGTGHTGSQNGTCPGGVTFYGPLAIIYDSSNVVTIADSGNGLVRQAKVSTRKITTIAGSGTIGDGGPATNANLANPVDVKWDNTGTNYYIVDNGNNSIREVNTTANPPTITTVAGSGHPSQPDNEGDGGAATAATLNNPGGMALDAQGNLYIADSTNSVVRVVNMQSTPITVASITIAPGTIQTVAGQNGAVGCEPANGLCGDGGPATGSSVAMDYPVQVTVDGGGNIYISDYYDDRVRCVVNVAGGCPTLEQVNSQPLWPNTIPGEIVTVAGAGGGAGQVKDGIAAVLANVKQPYGLAIAGSDNLLMDDTLNDEIRCVSGATGAGGCSASAKVGYIYEDAFKLRTPGYTGDGGLATAALETVPQGLGFDPSGNLYEGGGGDLRVRRIDATTGNIMTVAGNAQHPGAPGYSGDGGLSTSATLDNLGLSVSGAEELLIADQGNNRIRQVDMVPFVALFEQKLNFGTVKSGTTSQPMPATMQNYGLATLGISGTQIQPTNQGFNISSNSCVNQLPPGLVNNPYQSTCTVQVTFTPPSPGSYQATLTITTSLGQYNITLLGTGD
jgi:trimeric autotransporter adhesin